MRRVIRWTAVGVMAAVTAVVGRAGGGRGLAQDAKEAGVPKLLRVKATVDGCGKIVFTKGKVAYEHKHWDPPTGAVFDDVPWGDLSATPVTWTSYAAYLDLSKAKIVKRSGRDTIALEHTDDGFDLYLCDSPVEAAEYDVTIAIPYRK